MSKKLFILTLIGLISATSAYAKCDGGTEITNSIGTTFCQSHVSLNWWSAASWCKANGMHLASMYEMCPSWDGTEGDNKCPELRGRCESFAISSTAYSSDRLCRVRCPHGDVLCDMPRQDAPWDDLALCKE